MRRKARDGKLDPIALDVLNRVDPDWRIPATERKWRASLRFAIAFRADYPERWASGRWGEDGRKVSTWLMVQRQESADPKHASELDEVLPGWRTVGRSSLPHIAFGQRLDELEQFVARTGQLPSASSEEPTERALGQWVAVKTRDATTAQRELLDLMFPEWHLTARQRQWNVRAAQVAGHRKLTGRWPVKGADDALEATLGSWLTTQMVSASDERRAFLDREIRGWDQRGADETWSLHFATALAWFAEHPGQHPKANAKDEADRRVRQWLDNQKTKASAERIAELDSAYPAWRGRTGDEVWAENLAAAVAWTAANGRLPAQSVKPEGQWLGVQRRPNVKPERAAVLDKALPGWR